MTTLRIEVEEIRGTPKKPGKAAYRVFFEGKELLTSRKPFMDSARAILLEGYPQDATLEMSRRGSSQIDLRGKLGPTSRETVYESKTSGPYFTEFIPFRRFTPPED